MNRTGVIIIEERDLSRSKKRVVEMLDAVMYVHF